MKKILLLVTLVATLNASIAIPPDTIMASPELIWPTEIKLKAQNDNISTGTTLIVAGAMLAGIGLMKEIAREPYPTHPTNINYKPDAPMVINYMLIGSGLTMAGYGIRVVLKF